MVLWDCHTDIVDATGIRALLLHDGTQHSMTLYAHIWYGPRLLTTCIPFWIIIPALSAAPGFTRRKTKNAAPESLLNSGDVNLNNLFR